MHPLYTKKKKFDFLNKHVPIDTNFKPIPVIEEGGASPRSDRQAEKERKKMESRKRIEFEQKVEAEQDKRTKRMRSIIKKVDETARQREAKQKSI